MLDRFTGEHCGGVVRPRRRRTMPAAIPARSGTLQCPIWILQSACATNIAARASPVTLDSRILLAGHHSPSRQTLSRVLESGRGVSGEVDETACRCLNAAGVEGDR